MTLQHLVTRDEAALIRYYAAGGGDDQLDEPGRSWRIYQPGEGEAIGVVPASGRAGCRECGQTIEAGEDAIVFGFDSLASADTPSFGARLARAYLHAAPCRDYPEEERDA